jgi:surfeit locus 1 family protein
MNSAPEEVRGQYNPDLFMQFQPGWKLSLFVALLLPCLIGLGTWQLHRAEEKRDILAKVGARRTEAALTLQQLMQREQPAFSQVELRGRYWGDKAVLLDNKIHRGQFGYEVVMPLRSESGPLLLVSLGWTAGSLDRSQLPAVEPVAGVVDLRGEVYVPLAEAFTLGDAEFPAGWPKRLQTLDVEALAEALGEPLYPYVIRLGASSPGALEQYWQDVNILPAKHTGYALQWFAMAATLVILYFAVAFGFLRSRGDQPRDN